jgi:hypothetical protein
MEGESNAYFTWESHPLLKEYKKIFKYEERRAK